MKSLQRKLWRDVKALRWQITSIALVVGSGVAVLLASLGAFGSLERARARFYATTAFADVFVHVARAPDEVAEALARVDGVASVETRLTFDVPLELDGVREPMSGRVLSLPAPGRVGRSRLFVVSGRLPALGARLEVAINEAFAKARHLTPGSRLAAVLNGRREELTVVGLVVAPEYIAALRPGEMLPDDEHFGLLWLPYDTLASSYAARGTFDEAVLWLGPGAREASVIREVDRLLSPYGGYGANGRRDQPAHRFVDGELEELEVEATVLPVIFLGVAAFLLNAVLARIVAQERTQIATLRALGFRIAPIVRHYLSLAALIAALGSLLGVLLGVPMGVGLTRTYGDFFHFPDLHYELEPLVVVAALCTSVSAALLGALAPVLKVLRMPPAEAMQPPSPHAFEASWLERSGVSRHLPTNLRLVVRNVARRPWRTVSAVSGVAAAMAVLVVGAFWSDALDALLEHQFRRVQHDDATVGLVSPTRDRAVRELARVPGVRLVEGIRALPVRLSSGGRSKRAELLGLTSSTTLRRLVTRDGHEVALPADGLVLSRHLARRLRAGPGTALTLDVLEGKRARREVRVAFVVDELLGESAYMRSDALFRLLAEAPTVSAAYLAIEPGREAEVHAALRRFPGVAAVNVTRAFVRRFEDTLMEIVVLFSLVLTLFGALVVVGVVYNTARILVAEREREFATLRVLGFGRADISESLFLELGVQVLPALGLGALMGYGLSAVAVRLFGPEDMSIPLVIGSRTWGLALAVVVVSAVGSALVVRRRLDRLDLLAVLKVRE